jgi:acyl-CoA synthetase (AMP-forming)/AMP-acid ligase II
MENSTLGNVNSLVEVLKRQAEQQPQEKLFTFLNYKNNPSDEEISETGLSYGELDQKARSIAGFLQGMNAAGERALLVFEPGLDNITAFFGCLYAGVIPIPTYPSLFSRYFSNIQAVVLNSDAKYVLTTAQVLRSIRLEDNSEFKKLSWMVTDYIGADLSKDYQEIRIKPESTAYLQFTSGTTADPKGVMLSHENLLQNTAVMVQKLSAYPNQIMVTWLPPYHNMGLIGGILLPLYGGFPSIIMSPGSFFRNPFRWLEAISKYHGTLSVAPDFAYELCRTRISPGQKLNLDLSSWQFAFNGAEPIRAATIDGFAAEFQSCGFERKFFYPCYGLAEGTLLVAAGRKADGPLEVAVDREALGNGKILTGQFPQTAQRIISCGQSPSNQVLKIVDPVSLQVCQANEIGEIWLRGPSIAQGYWNNPQLTAETFQAKLWSEEGEFLRTGDLGFVNHDGDLFITGRLKELIKLRGRNYYPQDLENAVRDYNSKLSKGQIAAFSITEDGEEKLVIAAEYKKSKEEDPGEIAAAIAQIMKEQFQIVPHAIILIKPATLPITTSGKVKRKATAEAFIGDQLSVIYKSER